MAIGGKCFGQLALAHKDEAYGVAEGVSFVIPCEQKINCFMVKCGIHPNDFVVRIAMQVNENLQGGSTRHTSHMRERNPFGQDIIMDDMLLGLPIQITCLRVKCLRIRMQAKQPRGVNEHHSPS